MAVPIRVLRSAPFWAFAAVSLVFLATAWGDGGSKASPTPAGYYGLLTEALTSGHLHLLTEPDPRLATLANRREAANKRAAPGSFIDRSVARARVSLAAAMVLPAGAVGACLAWYNYARFGSITEFGFRYQFTGGDQRFIRMWNPSYIPSGLANYTLSDAFYTIYYPFVLPSADHVGILAWAPVCALDARSDFNPSDPWHVRVGRTTGPFLPNRFPGAIAGNRRSAIPDEASVREGGWHGPVRLHFRLPRFDHVSSEPLVSTGHPGAEHILDVSFGSLEAPAGKPPPADAALRMRLHGGWVLSASRPSNPTLPCEVVLLALWTAYPAQPTGVAAGRNPIGGSLCASTFSGTITDVHHEPTAGMRMGL